MNVSDMTHDDIADHISHYLKGKGYELAFSNMTDPLQWEQPDVMGMNIYGESIVCEVKVSRADFKADFKKGFREEGKGTGDYRVYVTPKGLLSSEEIPYGWMLWEIHGKTKPIVKIIKGMKKVKEPHPDYSWSATVRKYLNTTEEEYNYFVQEDKNYRTEYQWLHKIVRRAEEDGIDMNLYAKGQKARERYTPS